MFLQRLFQARSRRSVSWLVLTSQVVSLLFSPFYLPVIAFAALLVFSYLNMLPLLTKVLLLVLVYCFTIALPHFFIFLYRKFNGWTRHQLGRRERRYVPYAVSIASYASLFYILASIHVPRFALAIIAGALSIQVVCALVRRGRVAHGLCPHLLLRPYGLALPDGPAQRHGLHGALRAAATHAPRTGLGRGHRRRLRLLLRHLHLSPLLIIYI